ncbi:phage portal protein [Jeotgalibacillus salarius]|uniref:Phage portal protein n=1 Tax=Jeotgalibacillus salarius TaxID=546023 RepID=A0A4Y8LKW7_9BACL|nr:phage portal protein [Jeotgalibacillus salarius]TFE03202.1 phage portal protein [Jeotgalibacillus salarius]
MDSILRKNSAVAFSFDLELLQNDAKRIYMKKLAIDTCASFLARTISQSDFRVKEKGSYKKNDLYYRLNVRPNKNMTASTFWQQVVYKLVYDNECLIIQADDEDLLIADDFEHKEYAVKEDVFSKVVVKDWEFTRTFLQNEVLHLRYSNEKLSPLIDSLFNDYGELFGRLLTSQKRKNQIRSTVDMDANTAKNEQSLNKLQEFINKMYKAVSDKDIAIIPQMPGFGYKEHFSGGGNGIQSVDEINKVTKGFLDQVALSMHIPTSLLYGDIADVEKQTKNYMMFAVNPFLKKIKDEANYKFFEKAEYMNGDMLDIRPISYNTLFDIADKVDKLVSSGAFTGNEIREEAGKERSDNPNLDKHFITKNYTEIGSLEGGENEK